MTRHHRADARVNGRLKRNKLDCVQALATNIDLRKSAVRIDRGVAVSGKVFCGRNHARGLGAFGESRGKSRNLSRIFSVRAHVDDGIRGVVVDVNDRRKNLMYSECACFASGDLALPARVFRITSRAHCHVPGEVHRIVKAHARARFQVSRNQ